MSHAIFGHTQAKKVFIAYLKFIFNPVPVFLFAKSGSPTSLQSFFFSTVPISTYPNPYFDTNTILEKMTRIDSLIFL